MDLAAVGDLDRVRGVSATVFDLFENEQPQFLSRVSDFVEGASKAVAVKEEEGAAKLKLFSASNLSELKSTLP